MKRWLVCVLMLVGMGVHAQTGGSPWTGPSPSVIASIAAAATQMNADVAMLNAGITTMQNIQAAVDADAGNIRAIGPAQTSVQGLVLAALPNLGCVGSDASGFPDVACSPTAFDPYPTLQLAQSAAGTTQGTCFQMTTEIVVINGGAGGGVCLPPASSGIPATVISVIGGAVTIYPNGTDTISSGATGVGVTLPGLWSETYRPTTASAWQPYSSAVPVAYFASLASPAFTGGVSFAGPVAFNGNGLFAQVIGHQGTALVVATNGGTATVPASVDTEYLNPTGSISTFALTMPAAPANGQEVAVLCGQVITTLTLTANTGQFMRPAISGAATTISGTCQPSFNGAARVRYNANQTAWYPG